MRFHGGHGATRDGAGASTMRSRPGDSTTGIPADGSAAPDGVDRCDENRGIAISCGADAEWPARARLANRETWASDPRFATLAARLASQDALDALVTKWMRMQEPHGCVNRLHAVGFSGDRPPGGAAQRRARSATGGVASANGNCGNQDRRMARRGSAGEAQRRAGSISTACRTAVRDGMAKVPGAFLGN
jgi:hypothetical protein